MILLHHHVLKKRGVCCAEKAFLLLCACSLCIFPSIRCRHVEHHTRGFYKPSLLSQDWEGNKSRLFHYLSLHFLQVQNAVITGSTTGFLLPQTAPAQTAPAQNGVRSSSRKRKPDSTVPASGTGHQPRRKPTDEAEESPPRPHRQPSIAGRVQNASGDAAHRQTEDEGPTPAPGQAAGRPQAHGGVGGLLGLLQSNATAKKQRDAAAQAEGDGNLQTHGEGLPARSRRSRGVASVMKGAGGAARQGTGLSGRRIQDSRNVSEEFQGRREVAGSGVATAARDPEALGSTEPGRGGADGDEGGRGGEQVAPSVVWRPLYAQV